VISRCNQQSVDAQIVPEASACIDGPEIMKERIPGADHRSMAKYSTHTDKGYEIVLDYIIRCIDLVTTGPLDKYIASIADQCKS
jgi:hypothetical protein